MDVAAQQITQLVQRILPERPHHLAISPDIRYCVPLEFWPKESPLQFTTYVSEADRGVLLTRPFYDIQLQPDEDTGRNKNASGVKKSKTSVPDAPSPATPLADKRETKKKVSLRDYQSKLKKSSGSPPDSAAKLNAAQNSGRSESMSAQASHRLPPKPDVNGDRKYNPSPSRSPRPQHNSDIAGNRKRVAEAHEASRPHKRSRSDSSMSSDSPPASSQIYQRTHRLPSPLDPNSQKEDRKRSTAAGQASMPRMNGHHSQRVNEDLDQPSDMETVAALPPILSPLHFNPDRDRDRDHDHESAAKRRRPPTVPISKAPSKAKASKAPDSPFHIPPLLSPTLPAIVEQELSRLARPSNKTTPLQKGSQEPPEPESNKKPVRPVADREREVGYREPQREAPKELPNEPRELFKEPLKEPKESKESKNPKELKEPRDQPALKKAYMVTLKYKKKNVKRVQRLLALQPTPMKAPPRTERSLSVEDTPPPSMSKKRPVQADNTVGDASTVSFKHPRTVADKSISAAKAPAAPATPLRAIPMARGASNNSQGLTPSESASYTPRSTERPPTSQSDQGVGTTVSEYRHRYDVYLKMGTKLKRDRDAIVKSRLANGNTKSADGAPTPMLLPAEKKLVAALSLEMVMSYMIAFKSLNQGRFVERKTGDITVWERLMPHLAELRSHARQFRPIEALALQLRAVCFEQMLAAFSGHEAQSVATKLLKATKLRMDAWTDAQNSVNLVSSESMRVVIGPWLGVEDAVRTILPILRRWCDKENVAWEKELQLPTTL